MTKTGFYIRHSVTTCSNCERYCEVRQEKDGVLRVYSLEHGSLLPTGEKHVCGEHDRLGSSYDYMPV